MRCICVSVKLEGKNYEEIAKRLELSLSRSCIMNKLFPIRLSYFEYSHCLCFALLSTRSMIDLSIGGVNFGTHAQAITLMPTCSTRVTNDQDCQAHSCLCTQEPRYPRLSGNPT